MNIYGTNYGSNSYGCYNNSPFSSSAFGGSSSGFGGCNAMMQSGDMQMMSLLLQVVSQLIQSLQNNNQGGNGNQGCQHSDDSGRDYGQHNQGRDSSSSSTHNHNHRDNGNYCHNVPDEPPVPVNNAPEAADDRSHTSTGKPVTIDVLANDQDADGDQLSISSYEQPANGSVTEQDGKLVYTPNEGFSGKDSFSYTVDDGKGGTSTADVCVKVSKQTNAKDCTVSGDPHFVGADGGKYDVQGEAGKTYNILSDANIQVNATFQKYGNAGATTMGAVGVSMGKDQVEIGAKGDLSINGETKADGTYDLDGGTVTKNGSKITLNSSEYDVDVKSAGSYLNLTFNSKDVTSDGVDPHGLWGQTADGDGVARNGDKGAGAQGGGVLEKLDGTIAEKGDKTTVQLYEVAGLFDTAFTNFNRFNDAGSWG